MGGCASSMLEWRSNQSLCRHDIISDYRDYGVEAEAVPGTMAPGYSAIYRFAGTTDEEHARLTHEFYNGPSWLERVQRRVRRSPDSPAMAYRVVEQVEQRSVAAASGGPARVMNYYHCTAHRTLTCAEMWKAVLSFGRGLIALGLAAQATVTLYEETRWEWLVSVYGAWTQHMVVATVYANLGEDALRHALRETCSDAVVCNGAQIGVLAALLAAEGLRPVLITLDEVPAGAATHGLQVVSWTEVVARGQGATADDDADVTANSDDVCLIMYTSGTTGDPKGVVHTHGSIAAGCEALNHRLLDLYRPNEAGEVYCAYLPLAHILEFAVVNIFLDRGTLVGFGSPRTLTDAHALPHGDLREYKPTVLIGVPRVFDTIRSAVEAKLPPRNSFTRDVFDKAFDSRRTALLEGSDTPYWNDKVFSKARAALGGSVYGMLSGGGPLSAATQEFINVVCGGPLLLQGWGLTETVCCGATQRLGDLEPHCVGQLVKTCEMRLGDVEEYKHTDTPHPRGELCLRGPFLFKGYYRHPELTREAIDKDGWFHTGDVGSIDAEGRVSIVGRIKALAKNCLGEYIALEALEAVYGDNELCAANGVCVLVHPDKPYVAALVLTEPRRAVAFARQHRIAVEGGGGDDETAAAAALLRSAAFHTAAAASLALTAKAAGRKSFEMVKHVRVLLDEWTPENGLVTPTMKLRRTRVAEHYAAVVAELFAA
ncbi:long-chain-fatty-acid-CoA ligase [Novymonas esmeraldas]|uniref:Long-chain-fatty-acid-CoA ligase n=1 Tax=Novymonas esmeraldas TaxID=1808958 RepID=A0AAW0EN00_9TRYP